jgi:hypothetical protein
MPAHRPVSATSFCPNCGVVYAGRCFRRYCPTPEQVATVRTSAVRGQSRLGYPGDANPNAKLTADQVRRIRARYVPGVVSQQVLAAQFSVSHSTIQKIVTRRTWRHVK